MVAIVDDEDFEFLSQFKWHCTSAGYAARRSKRENGESRILLMHRVILNTFENTSVDHIDGNPLNNRKSNIRIVEHWQNMLNKKVRKDSSTGIKGVQKYGNRWRVIISVRNIRHRIGSFLTIDEAINAYNNAAIRLHGEYARLSERAK